MWISGCGLLGSPKPPVLAVQAGPNPDLGPVAPLLEMMSNLPQGDPARQAEVFQQAKEAAELQPHDQQQTPLCAGFGHAWLQRRGSRRRPATVGGTAGQTRNSPACGAVIGHRSAQRG